MEGLRVCQNCTFFLQDIDDMDFGVCLHDDDFEPFLDKIIENRDFSNCQDLYLRGRCSGETDACDYYEEVEVELSVETDEGNLKAYVDELKSCNVEDVVRQLYNPDREVVSKGLSALSLYVYLGNTGACEGLIKYYEELGPAQSLDDVRLRVKIIGLISRLEEQPRVIEAYVNELARTPSNNTTRQLYTLILERLGNYRGPLVHDLLMDLLQRQDYASKIRQRIVDVAWQVVTERDYEPWW